MIALNMSPDQYQQLMAEMQIHRGQLEHGFRQEMGAVASTKPLVNLPKGLLPEPKVELPYEDLSALNSPHFRKLQRHGRVGGKKRQAQ